MPTPKIVFSCDHTIKEKAILSVTKNVVRGYENANYDILTPYTVEKIQEVTSLDGSVTYFDTTDYRQYLHNKILWVQSKIPIGTSYNITFTYSIEQEIPYEPIDCPRCGGIGWYVDMINLALGRMERVSGIERIAQDIVKMLLTEVGSDKHDNSYGTIVPKIPGSTLKTNALSALKTIVNSVETTYLNRQSKSLVPIPSDELLSQLTILDIGYANDAQTRIIMSLEITNATGDSVTANLAVGGR